MWLIEDIDGNRINQGIAEKLAAVFQGFALFFSSFIVALAVSWKLALIVMSIVRHDSTLLSTL